MSHARLRSAERVGTPMMFQDENELIDLVEAGVSDLIRVQPDGREIHQIHWSKKNSMVRIVIDRFTKSVVTVLPLNGY